MARLGLVFASGHNWSSNRRFALRVLKDFGFGRSTLEDTIVIEVEHFINSLKKYGNKPCKIDSDINVVILNVVWTVVAGKSLQNLNCVKGIISIGYCMYCYSRHYAVIFFNWPLGC